MAKTPILTPAAATKKEKKRTDDRAGLTLSSSRIQRALRRWAETKRVGSAAAVFLTAVLEVVTEEVLKGAAKNALAHKHVRMTPVDLRHGIVTSPELMSLDGVSQVAVIMGGGVNHTFERCAARRSVRSA